MNQEFIAFLSTPFYAALIALELFSSHLSGIKGYDKKETLNTVFLGLLGIVFDVLMKGVCFGVLDGINERYGLISWPGTALAWVGVFIAQDCCFYWMHRAEHNIRLFWAVHVNHHSSQYFNFSVALRSSALQPLYRYMFFAPCAVLGFSAYQIMLIYTINQIYQFFLHTERVGKYYNWIEYLFVTPSHHRVHHASNPDYLDKNMGQVLIIWDRMFGTFAQEIETPVFGITKPIKNQGILNIWLHEFNSIARAILNPSLSLSEKVKLVWGKPGYEPQSLNTEENLS